jgi:KDO2-lipid IV(A) lauroyltransferase
MAKKSKTQVWVEYGAVRIILGFFGLLPRKVSVGAAILLAKTVYPLLGGLRRTGMRSLEIAFPEKPVEERESLLKASFENLGRVLGELSQFRKYSKERLSDMFDFGFMFDSKDRAKYDRLKEAGGHRGTILVGPHHGNWEIGVFAYSALEHPFHYLARPLDNPKIEELLVDLRTKFGNRPINKNNSVGASMEVLRNDEGLGVLPDVNVHPKDGVFVPFFGVPACTTSGVALLALRMNSLIVPMSCVWDRKSGKYRVLYGDIIAPVHTGDRHRDVVETTALYTAEIEKFIRAYPDQWMWIHKRWKTRPPGEKELY